MAKAFTYFISFVFLLFAGLQYNDPDWYLWIPVYLIISVLIFLSVKQKLPKLLLNSILLLLIVWFVFLIPDLIHWLQGGMPNIAGTMKASNTELELMREFLGILICIGDMFW